MKYLAFVLLTFSCAVAVFALSGKAVPATQAPCTAAATQNCTPDCDPKDCPLPCNPEACPLQQAKAGKVQVKASTAANLPGKPCDPEDCPPDCKPGDCKDTECPPASCKRAT